MARGQALPQESTRVTINPGGRAPSIPRVVEPGMYLRIAHLNFSGLPPTSLGFIRRSSISCRQGSRTYPGCPFLSLLATTKPFAFPKGTRSAPASILSLPAEGRAANASPTDPSVTQAQPTSNHHRLPGTPSGPKAHPTRSALAHCSCDRGTVSLPGYEKSLGSHLKWTFLTGRHSNRRGRSGGTRVSSRVPPRGPRTTTPLVSLLGQNAV